MNIVTEDFVSFETARLIKEKGFNEKVICYYDDGGSLNLNKFVEFQCCNQGYGSSVFAAPTLQMVCKWLREVHNINIEVFVIKNYDKKICEYMYTIMDLNFPSSDDGIDCCNKHKTYEQACEEAIKYCLENLI